MAEYISREAVVRYLKGYSEKECNSNSPYSMITSSVLNKAERALSEMPAADVQPVVHGKWIEHINHRYDYDREQGDIDAGVSYTCSLCNLHGFEGWHFCPNCGARMDGDAK